MLTQKIVNKKLQPGMVLVGGLTIIAVAPTHWSKEIAVTYQRPGLSPQQSTWSANGTKHVLVGE